MFFRMGLEPENSYSREGFGFVLGKDYFGGLGTVFFCLGLQAGCPVDGEEKTGDLYNEQETKKTGYIH